MSKIKMSSSKRNSEKEAQTKLIASLAQQIVHHQDLYYNKTPAISDGEFDALWDRLRELDPNHSVLTKLGSDDGFFPKMAHIMPMGSLEKAANETEFYMWAKSNDAEEYIVQHKLDGASLELQYRDGILHAAVTRGNGIVGDNIFINARKMQGVPIELAVPITCAVRGEVIMTHAVHKKYFRDKANCRNAANGLMKKKDGVGVQHLCVRCYDIWLYDEEASKMVFQFLRDDVSQKKNTIDEVDKSVKNVRENYRFSEEEKLRFLQICEFLVVPYHLCKSDTEVCEHRNAMTETREKLAYDIDGLVVKISYADKDDMLLTRPKGQIAFKFPLEHAVTVLRDVLWSESGHLHTPIAVLEPVRIAGTIVKRANLVHPQHIEDLQLRLGSHVMISKRGEIIPKIEKLIYTPDDTKVIAIPSYCNTCKTELINEGTRVYCPNLACARRLLFRVERWIAVNEIDHWGQLLLRRLVLEEKLIGKLGDIYRLSEKDLASLERIGEPLAKKLYTSLRKNTTIPFEKFLASIGLENVAMLTGEKLVAAGIKNWNSLLATEEDVLATIDGIGPIIARTIFDTVHRLREELEDVLQFVHIFKRSEKESTLLQGMSFCFTGTLIHEGKTISRKEAHSMVRNAGGDVKTSVTKDLRYLVTEDVQALSVKSKKAKEYGTELLDYQAFLKLLRGRKKSLH